MRMPSLPTGKSRVLRVTRTRWWTWAVARMMASGSLMRLALRIWMARSATSGESGRWVKVVRKLRTGRSNLRGYPGQDLHPGDDADGGVSVARDFLGVRLLLQPDSR